MRVWTRATAWMLVMALAWALLVPMALGEDYESGFYDASAPGYNGDVSLHVVIDSGRIVIITPTHSEDADVGGKAIDELVNRVLDAQSASVDGISGATETSDAFLRAMKDILVQAGGSPEEDATEADIPAIVIIDRPTVQPVANVAPPEIAFDRVHSVEDGISYIDDESIGVHWPSDDAVEEYRIEITDAAGTLLKGLKSSEPEYYMKKDMLAAGAVYTLNVIAIPKNGTLAENGVSSTARFALYIAPEPEPTPEPTPAPAPEPDPVPESGIDSIIQEKSDPVYQPMLRSDVLPDDQLRDAGYDPPVLGNSRVTRSQVRSIEFVDRLDDVGDGAWDVSAAGDGSAIAWMSDDRLIIAALGGVIAPTDAGSLFARYDRLESINFNESFFTGETANMAGMFYGCRNLRSLDLNDFNTGNVTDMSYMFYDCDSLVALDLSGQAGSTRPTTYNNRGTLVNMEPCGFDTGSVMDFRYMFANCDALGEIAVGDSFAILGLNMDTNGIFDGCRAGIRLNDKNLSASDWLPKASIDTELGKNSKGEAVKWLQRILKKAGYLSDAVDGDFGNNTSTALMSFQADEGLPQTGIADGATFRALCAAAARVNFVTVQEEQPAPSKTKKKKKSSSHHSSSGGGSWGL